MRCITLLRHSRKVTFFFFLPVPWLQGPSNMGYQQMFSWLYSVSRHHPSLRKHLPQNLEGEKESDLILCSAWLMNSDRNPTSPRRALGWRRIAANTFSQLFRNQPGLPCHLPSTLPNAIRGNGPASSQHHITFSTRKVPKVTLIFKNTIPLKA